MVSGLSGKHRPSFMRTTAQEKFPHERPWDKVRDKSLSSIPMVSATASIPRLQLVTSLRLVASYLRAVHRGPKERLDPCVKYSSVFP